MAVVVNEQLKVTSSMRGWRGQEDRKDPSSAAVQIYLQGDSGYEAQVLISLSVIIVYFFLLCFSNKTPAGFLLIIVKHYIVGLFLRIKHLEH